MGTFGSDSLVAYHDGEMYAFWLIDHAGFGKGFPGRGPARLSSKHVLALTNHADATAAELIDLAREVRNGVHARFGVWLEAEPVLVGLAL